MVVGSLGRLDAVKGYDMLLVPDRAAGRPRGRDRRGAARPGYWSGWPGLGVAERVELPGWSDRPAEALPGFDVFCLPSRSEGFPLSIVEAMLAPALPVVATRVGSVAELVVGGRRGSWSSATTSTAWSRRSAACATARCGRNSARPGGSGAGYYTVEQMARAYERLWARVVAAPRTPRLRPPAPHP